MTRNVIVQMIEETKGNIKTFYDIFYNETFTSRDFTDWAAKNVFSHINEWIVFSGNKLKSIRRNEQFEDITDTNIFNHRVFENTQNQSFVEIKDIFMNSLDEYKSIVYLYNEDELQSSTFPTGFSFELWKYMLLDSFIHPNLHLMQYYLKRGYYRNFTEIIEKEKDFFLNYSDNDYSVFSLKNIFENVERQQNCFLEFQKSIKNCDESIRKIIDVNI
jgi:hypothetical protein